MFKVNAEQTRAITDGALFGVACYQGVIVNGQFHGTHIGICRNSETAHQWLETGNNALMLTPIYPQAQAYTGVK
jgi:hypothetical protein